MKDIPLEFISNRDSCGNHTFRQLKRKDNLYLYSRTRVSDKTIHSYEVFRAKLIKKGAKLPGGLVEAEDRMQYPGCGGFGKFAKSCKTLAQAEHWFEVLESEKDNSPVEVSESDQDDISDPEIVVEKKPRGRTAKVVNVKIPKKGEKFTMKQLMVLNDESQPTLYVRLKSFLENGSVSIAGTIRKENTRGKPAILYLSHTDDFSCQDTVLV